MFKAVGGLIGAFGKYKEGQAKKQAAELNAQQVEQRAAVESTLRQRAGQREAGTIEANAGASGLTGGGSAADILRESARNTAFDLGTIKKQSTLQAVALRKEGKAAATAGKIGFLSGVASSIGDLLGGT